MLIYREDNGNLVKSASSVQMGAGKCYSPVIKKNRITYISGPNEITEILINSQNQLIFQRWRRRWIGDNARIMEKYECDVSRVYWLFCEDVENGRHRLYRNEVNLPARDENGKVVKMGIKDDIQRVMNGLKVLEKIYLKKNGIDPKALKNMGSDEYEGYIPGEKNTGIRSNFPNKGRILWGNSRDKCRPGKRQGKTKYVKADENGGAIGKTGKERIAELYKMAEWQFGECEKYMENGEEEKAEQYFELAQETKSRAEAAERQYFVDKALGRIK